MSTERLDVHPTAVVSPDAKIGRGCTIGAFAVIEAGVDLGGDSSVAPFCLLGAKGPGGTGPLRIGPGAIVRSHSVIYVGTQIGAGLRTGHGAVIREGAVIGRDVQVGTQSELDRDVVVGDHVRLHSKVFVPAHSRLDDFVWLFPGATLTNDPHPPSDSCTRGPTIGHHAVVGAGAIVLPGLDLGPECVVAAGSVVTRNVPAGRLMVGVPAADRGSASQVTCKEGRLASVYPWAGRFERGYLP